MDPLYLSLHYLRIRNYDKCSKSCKNIPSEKTKEKWYIICKARTEESWTDFSEHDDETAADIIFDESALSSLPRPGTSLKTGAVSSRGYRPTTANGRPLSGYTYVSSKGTRNISTNPSTNAGTRFTRLTTASLAFSGDEPDVTSINIQKFAKNPFLSRILVDYLLQRIRDPIRAVQLGSDCTKNCGFDDWWWKNRLGISYYLLGLNAESEAQFKSSIVSSPNIDSRLQLAKLYSRLDQPQKSLSELATGAEQFPQEMKFLLAQGHISDQLGDSATARDMWRKVLLFDQSSIEAAASLGAVTFYEDQPETSFRFYSFLKKLGVVNTAILNNMAMSSLSSGNLTNVGACLVSALTLAQSDEEKSDVWYNISHVAIHASELSMSQQALLIATTIDPKNGEAFNNLGLLELKKKNFQKALASFKSATEANPEMHEPWFNLALIYQRMGLLQEAYLAIEEAVKIFPDFTEALNLKQSIFSQLK